MQWLTSSNTNVNDEKHLGFDHYATIFSSILDVLDAEISKILSWHLRIAT